MFTSWLERYRNGLGNTAHHISVKFDERNVSGPVIDEKGMLLPQTF